MLSDERHHGYLLQLTEVPCSNIGTEIRENLLAFLVYPCWHDCCQIESHQDFWTLLFSSDAIFGAFLPFRLLHRVNYISRKTLYTPQHEKKKFQFQALRKTAWCSVHGYTTCRCLAVCSVQLLRCSVVYHLYRCLDVQWLLPPDISMHV